MKMPRDIGAKELIKALNGFGYIVTRQIGSHIRLTLINAPNEFHVTIPDHNPIKIGTLNSIIKEVANQLSISKAEIINKLV